MKKINKFYKKNKLKLIVIFIIIIPILIGFVGGTLGYVDRGFLGALAGFIRYSFFSFAILFGVVMLLANIYEHFYVKWKDTLGLIFIFLQLAAIIFIIWLLSNY
jgi:hypothetical protein